MTDGELERLRRERLEAGRAEEQLREDLRQARMRASAREHELNALRASTSFRFGHAVALALGAGWRLRPVRSAVRAALHRRRREPPERASVTPHGRADVVLFVAWGADEERLAMLVERVAQLHTILVRFRPVFVVDSARFEPIAARGYAVEHVIALEDWRRLRAPHEWGAYVTDRMAAIVAEHDPGTVVVLEAPEGRSALEQGVIDALVVPSLRASEDNLLSALDPDAETPRALARALVEETFEFTPELRDTQP